jgi:hypothetical protein
MPTNLHTFQRTCINKRHIKSNKIVTHGDAERRYSGGEGMKEKKP